MQLGAATRSCTVDRGLCVVLTILTGAALGLVEACSGATDEPHPPVADNYGAMVIAGGNGNGTTANGTGTPGTTTSGGTKGNGTGTTSGGTNGSGTPGEGGAPGAGGALIDGGA